MKSNRTVKLDELIRKGLEYIGFNNENKESKEINIELLLKIREYLYPKDDKWYNEKFHDAFEYDENVKQMSKKPYSDDGIEYYIDTQNYLKSYRLFDYNIEQEVLQTDKKVQLNDVSHYIENGDYFKYYYINEIDHFFTYCINRRLKNKEKGFYWDDEGLGLIFHKIFNQKME